MQSQTTCPQCGRVNAVDLNRDEQPRCGACGSMLPWIVRVDDSTLTAMLQRDILHLLKFTSASCGPCKQQTPVLKQVCALIDRQFPGNIRILEADVESCPQATRAWGVQSVPVTFLVRGGTVPTILIRFDGLHDQGQFLPPILESLAPGAKK